MKKYVEYDCSEYFDGDRYRNGVWSEPEQLFIVVPINELYEDKQIQMLVVGRPGVDGIVFGFRRGETGIWAYYPMSGEYKYMTPNLDELVTNWLDGKINV